MSIDRLWYVLFAIALAVASGCSGGSSSSDDDRDNILASFLASSTSPGMGDVTMAEGDALNNLVTVEIGLTDMTDVFAADFQVEWLDGPVRLMGWSEGPLLSKDGESTSFTVTETSPGLLRVQATRIGTADEVDAVGTEVLLILDFRVRRKGEIPLAFRPPDPSNPREITDSLGAVVSGGTWAGGRFLGV
jgi:hypothetical protein